MNRTIYTEVDVESVMMHGKPIEVVLPDPITDPLKTVYSTTFYIGLAIEAKDPVSNQARKLGLN